MIYGIAAYTSSATPRPRPASSRPHHRREAVAAGYKNYQQWLAGTQLEQRVSLEDYSVSNRGLRSDCRHAAAGRRPRRRVRGGRRGLLLLRAARSWRRWSGSRPRHSADHLGEARHGNPPRRLPHPRLAETALESAGIRRPAVEPEKLRSLFEAARWRRRLQRAALGVHRRHQGPADEFTKLLAASSSSTVMAQAAPVLMLTSPSELRQEQPAKPPRLHDVGQAIAQLAVQATAEGYSFTRWPAFCRPGADDLRHPSRLGGSRGRGARLRRRCGEPDGEAARREAARRGRRSASSCSRTVGRSVHLFRPAS